MRSWLPAQGSGLAVPRALLVVAAIVFQVIFVLNSEKTLGDSSLVIAPSITGTMEPGTTLGAFVPTQDFELQETVIDFLDSGVLPGRKLEWRSATPTREAVREEAPQQTPPRVSSPASKPAKTMAGPILTAPTAPTPSKPATTQPQAEQRVARRVSPFRKWVKPQKELSAEQSVEAVEKAAQPLSRPTTIEEPTAPKTPVAEKPAQPQQAPTTKQSQASRSEPEARPLPTKPLPPLTKSQQNLRRKVRRVLTHYYNRPLNTRDRSPWELMHAMLAFEADSKVLQGGPNGKPITAVGWLCFNQACKRRTLMYVDDDGKLEVRVGPALQGHRGQLLAMLAQSRINENYPMLVEGHEMKIADLIDMEKRTCYPRTELTFKLIALMYYLDSDATWLNDQGMTWNIPKLISEELRQPVRGAACGGTHRLSGLTLAYKTRELRGEPVDGQYLQAKRFVSRYQQYAYRLQNRDGSFSTEWFRGPGNEDSLDRKIKTTGHILEWLVYAADEQQLHHWRTTKAVNYLSNIMLNNRYKDWEAGPLGHAIHALLVYDRLVFSPYDAEGHSPLATKPVSSRR